MMFFLDSFLVHSPLELCCPVSLMTCLRNALEPDKIYQFFCQISFYAPLHHQYDLYGNSLTVRRFDRALVPTVIESEILINWEIQLENFAKSTNFWKKYRMENEDIFFLQRIFQKKCLYCIKTHHIIAFIFDINN